MITKDCKVGNHLKRFKTSKAITPTPQSITIRITNSPPGTRKGDLSSLLMRTRQANTAGSIKQVIATKIPAKPNA